MSAPGRCFLIYLMMRQVRSGGGAAVGEDGDGEDDRLGHGDLVVLLAHVLHDGLALGVEPRVLHKAENGSD